MPISTGLLRFTASASMSRRARLQLTQALDVDEGALSGLLGGPDQPLLVTASDLVAVTGNSIWTVTKDVMLSYKSASLPCRYHDLLG